MKRIALYGGSFNPPHVAHQLACTYVLATARPAVDEVWMVPTFKHPFEKPLAPFDDRVAMCQRAARPFGGRVNVSRIEEELSRRFEASYTLQTVEELLKRHPDCQFALVIGADLVDERERWHGWSRLKELIGFIVVGRGGYGESSELVKLPPVSSTEVRGRLQRGEPVDSVLDASVLDYIREKGLYR